VPRKLRKAPAEPRSPIAGAHVASEANEASIRPAHSYLGRKPASARASRSAKGSSKKTDTKPELILRRALWAAGLRYRKNPPALPGKPDVVFLGAKLAVFCDGDFWHGRNWEARQEKLSRGHNAEYWLAKIGRNMTRDAEVTAALREAGWSVLRVWESDVKRDVDAVVAAVRAALGHAQRPDEIG
jgi:DNA mismatch endonuclease (patch repair protein)